MKLTVVKADQVPPPSRGGGGVSSAAFLYAKLQELKRGEAMRVELPNAKVASYLNTCMNKLAKAEGDRLGMSRAEGGAVRFYWIEPAN